MRILPKLTTILIVTLLFDGTAIAAPSTKTTTKTSTIIQNGFRMITKSTMLGKHKQGLETIATYDQNGHPCRLEQTYYDKGLAEGRHTELEWMESGAVLTTSTTLHHNVEDGIWTSTYADYQGDLKTIIRTPKNNGYPVGISRETHLQAGLVLFQSDTPYVAIKNSKEVIINSEIHGTAHEKTFRLDGTLSSEQEITFSHGIQINQLLRNVEPDGKTTKYLRKELYGPIAKKNDIRSYYSLQESYSKGILTEEIVFNRTSIGEETTRTSFENNLMTTKTQNVLDYQNKNRTITVTTYEDDGTTVKSEVTTTKSN